MLIRFILELSFLKKLVTNVLFIEHFNILKCWNLWIWNFYCNFSICASGINTSIPRKPRNLANTSTVDLKLVMDTLNNVYGTSQALSEENDAFPIQQKVLVCTLLLMMKNGPSKDVALGKVIFAKYLNYKLNLMY